MARKTWLLVFLLLALHFCQSKSAQDVAQSMAKAYAENTAKYTRLEDELNAKMRNTSPSQGMKNLMSNYNSIMTAKKADLEKLLHEYENGSGSDELDLIRSKIMIELGRFADAEKIIHRLGAADSDLAVEAKMQKVFIHLLRRQNEEALALFEEIEARAKKDTQLFNVYLALANNHPDTAIREKYSLKFVSSPELPIAMQPFKSRVYANLASLAKNELLLEKARGYLEQALVLQNDPTLKAHWQAELKHLNLINRPAPALQAESWLNTAPLSLAALKGRVVVIDFWAPWCNPCRVVMPVLLDEFRKYKSQGLQVIGYTKLYGRYSDDLEKKDRVSAAEELALIKKYLARNQVTYPVAVAAEGKSFDDFAITAIPAIIFINRRGNVAFIKSGGGNTQQIRDKIKSLLAE